MPALGVDQFGVSLTDGAWREVDLDIAPLVRRALGPLTARAWRDR
jgi:hypothetical protein